VRDALDGTKGSGGPVDLAELVRAAGTVDRTEPVAVVASTVAVETDVDRLVDVLGDHHITTAEGLTALDPTVVALADQPVRRLAEAIQGARAQATGRPQLRHGVAELVVPSADVEIDIDMESALDGTAYLWGAWVDGSYRSVTSWDPPSPEREAQVFADFWVWLTHLRQEAAAQGRTVATYCWFKGAESGALRRGAKAAASVLGHFDAPVEVEELLAGDQFVDLYEVFTTQLVTGGSAGLKVVATLAGFTWRDTDPNGADSMAWHAQAVGDPDPERRTEARHRLLAYNEDDVRATAAVRTWLRTDLGARPGTRV
jgi:predicted RecB family nuclease